MTRLKSCILLISYMPLVYIYVVGGHNGSREQVEDETVQTIGVKRKKEKKRKKGKRKSTKVDEETKEKKHKKHKKEKYIEKT